MNWNKIILWVLLVIIAFETFTLISLTRIYDVKDERGEGYFTPQSFRTMLSMMDLFFRENPHVFADTWASVDQGTKSPDDPIL